jgi:molybdopterin-guanine dinucleotide biosynthesis protein A
VAENTPLDLVDGWLLCGGEGRRMGGQDKGLLPWHGTPLVLHAARILAPQLRQLTLNANRHLDQYAAWDWPVQADDTNLPPQAGPLAGMLTGLRQASAPWTQFSPCDSPSLPHDLVYRLWHAAVEAHALVAVPLSTDQVTGKSRHHWTTALVHRDAAPVLSDKFQQGERRVGECLRACPWIGVCFERPADFLNINTPETMHGTPWH